VSPAFPLLALAFLPAAYLLGAVPSSFLLARWIGGMDLRQVGSRNLGATNLYRVLGWKAAIPAGVFDVAKGALPVALAVRAGVGPTWWPLVVGLVAVLGHVYSPFVGFRGGKGVATAAGVFVALAPAPLGVAAVVWVSLLTATGYMSVASMTGAVAFAVAMPLLRPGRPSLIVSGVLVCAFILFTHRSNIRRLVTGTESRFGTRRGGAA
jgi:acyl phosphate:glycerol-3-phosphate acyltransferase